MLFKHQKPVEGGVSLLERASGSTSSPADSFGMASTTWRRLQNRVRGYFHLPPVLRPDEQEDRYVYPNSPEQNAQFCDNSVITSKYTWYNFPPLFLFEQFTRFANAYFLLVSILQTIPDISITNGIPTNFLPLSIVLTFDGIVTAREDYKRHLDDARANASKTLTLRNGVFREILWRDVKVGDIIKIRRNEAVPADCIFLSACSPDSNTPDTCYVQTAQLDGETNLKLRQAVPATVQFFQSDQDCATFHGFIRCEPPNASFDKFIGTLHMSPAVDNPAPGQAAPGIRQHVNETGLARATQMSQTAADQDDFRRPIPLESEQTLLRGSIVRNVDYVYAIPVYTGRETKVRVRQTSRVAKKAQSETEINRFIVLLIGLLFAFCITGTAGAVSWTKIHVRDKFLQIAKLSVIEGIRLTFTYFLLNASFIPVSLYVTVRLARSFQMFFMEKDKEMFYHDADLVRATNGLDGQYPFKVRTMDLNDELGQITHIFSDKTGTLTLNYMEFRKLLVNGVAYGLGTTQIGLDRLRREGRQVDHIEAEMADRNHRKSVSAPTPHFNFEDGSESHPSRTFRDDRRLPNDGAQGTAIHHFLLHLVLNHTVLPEVVRDNYGNVIGARLSASSPDEEAFLCSAEAFGYKFHGRTPDSIFIATSVPLDALPIASSNDASAPFERAAPGWASVLPFRILHILAYSQDRKRMSVIVEHPSIDPQGRVMQGGGEVYLYCKGADSVIFPRLGDPIDALDAQNRKFTKRTLGDWGSDGLRTLVFAFKRLSKDEITSFTAAFTAACSDIEEIKKRKSKQENAIDSLMEAMETSLILQGATANEDKLQPEVPETIATLAKAGIKVWMVTGDKQETAVNIGFATRLLDDNMRQIVATAESAGDVRSAIKRIRIAAKRMHQERVADTEHAQQNRNAVQNTMEWMVRRLETVESSLGFAIPHVNNHTLPTREARGSIASEASAKLGPTAKSPSRSRGESFQSDEGEAHAELEMASIAPTSYDEDASSPAGLARLVPDPTPAIQLQRVVVAPAGDSQVKENPLKVLCDAQISATPTNMLSTLSTTSRRPFALIIDEQVLDAALSHDRSRAYLLYVSVNCNAVICCRARPDQKARVVQLIRQGVPYSRTLAVGDGANDVDMIRQAHVGVGISGAEGVQAANASDYSIGRFRFLQRLLLVHGRWNYARMSRLVLYTFYKNLLFVCAQFWYSTLTGFSGQKYYVEFGNQTYNLLYTALPLLMMGIYDQDIDADTSLKYPQLYDHGRLTRGLNVRVFVSWFLGAIAESLLIFFFCRAAYTVPDPTGSSPYVFQLGTVVFSCVLAVVTLRVAAEMHTHYWWFQFFTFGSAIIWIPACFIFDAMDNDGMRGGMQYVFGSAAFWMTLLLVLGASAARLMAWKAFKRFYRPQLRHIVQEAGTLTHVFEQVNSYTEAVDIARKTGKSVAEVVDTAKIINASSLLAQRSPAVAPGMKALQQTAAIKIAGRGRQAAALPPVDMNMLHKAYPPARRPRLDTESGTYDPDEDFDKETIEEQATFTTPASGAAGTERARATGLLAEMHRSGLRLPRQNPSGRVLSSTLPASIHGRHYVGTSAMLGSTSIEDDDQSKLSSPARRSSPQKLGARNAVAHGAPSRSGSTIAIDPASAEYVSTHFTVFGPHKPPVSRPAPQSPVLRPQK